MAQVSGAKVQSCKVPGKVANIVLANLVLQIYYCTKVANIVLHDDQSMLSCNEYYGCPVIGV